ncbi:MAG: hypothetical protein AMJ75_09800 [Phycisphaerae bacterium SM1_79]|nr:MAG: hypothetical protein AMJ75_09800 [Phycisphaerae bacterium SM1_79]
MTWIRRGGSLGVLLLCICYAVVCADDELPEQPPGSFFPLQVKDHAGADSFGSGEPVVGTTYFYWYDVDTKVHIIDSDGSDALTTHPADMENVSYRRAAWHTQQLADMVDAGVDFLMPVYWGVPGKYDGWSFVGLPPLIEAHSRLQKDGLDPPAIGLFYDTSILKWNGFSKDGRSYHVDLTTEFGKEWFYTAIRDFFSLVPPAKWARIDGRPIIFLYASAFAKKQDPEQLDYAKRRFKADFGIEPFIVKSSGWQGQADATYSWGGAVSGPLIYRQVVALGPGYDHSAVPGRSPLVVERRDGRTYIERWLKVLHLNPAHRPWIVHLETWNEWHEGTDVAESREYGRSYIVLTRLFADMWRAKSHLQIGSPYADSGPVTWRPGRAKGLSLRQSGGDGVWKRTECGGVDAVVCDHNPHSDESRYLYFNVDDTFAYELYQQSVVICATYKDAGCSSFRLEYDSSDPKAGPFEGAFSPAGSVSIEGSGKWKTAAFTLAECCLMNRCNGADFRFAVLGGELELAISSVELVRAKPVGEKE